MLGPSFPHPVLGHVGTPLLCWTPIHLRHDVGGLLEYLAVVSIGGVATLLVITHFRRPVGILSSGLPAPDPSTV